MATNVACYDVITDGNTSLTIGGDIDAELGIGVTGINTGVRSVLSFMLKADDPSNLTFQISVKNGNNVTTNVINNLNINSNVWRVFQEVIDANVLTATGNKLKIKVLSGSGTLVLSDIVLLYMKAV